MDYQNNNIYNMKVNFNINTFISWLKKQNLDSINENFFNLKELLFFIIIEKFIYFNEEEKELFLNYFINIIKQEKKSNIESYNSFKENIGYIIGLLYLIEIEINIKNKISKLIYELFYYLINVNQENLKEINIFLDNLLIEISNNLSDKNKDQINALNYLYIISSIHKFIKNKDNIFIIIEYILKSHNTFEINNKISEIINEMLKEKDFHFIDKNISTICRIVYSYIELNNSNFELWTNILKLEKNNNVVINIINSLLSNKFNLNFIDETQNNELIQLIKECYNNNITLLEIKNKIYQLFENIIYPILQYIENEKICLNTIYDSIMFFSNHNLISNSFELIMILLIKYDNFSNYLFENCIKNFDNKIYKHILCLIIMKNYRTKFFNCISKMLINKIKETKEILNDIYFIMLYGTLLFRENDNYILLNYIFEIYIMLKNDTAKKNINFILLKLYNDFPNNKKYLFSKEIITIILNNNFNFFQKLDNKIICQIFSNNIDNKYYIKILLNSQNFNLIQKIYLSCLNSNELIYYIYNEYIINQKINFIGKNNEFCNINFQKQIFEKIQFKNDINMINIFSKYLKQIISLKIQISPLYIDFFLIIIEKNKYLIYNNYELLSYIIFFIKEQISLFTSFSQNIKDFQIEYFFQFINLLYSIYNFKSNESFEIFSILIELYKIKKLPFILITLLLINIQFNYENQYQNLIMDFFEFLNQIDDKILINIESLKTMKLIIYSLIKLMKQYIFPKNNYQNIIVLLIHLLNAFSELFIKKKKIQIKKNNLSQYFHIREDFNHNKNNYCSNDFEIKQNKDFYFKFDNLYNKLINYNHNDSQISTHISINILNFFNPYEEMYKLFSSNEIYPYFMNCSDIEKKLFEYLYKNYSSYILSSRKIINIKQ